MVVADFRLIPTVVDETITFPPFIAMEPVLSSQQMAPVLEEVVSFYILAVSDPPSAISAELL